MMRFAAFRTRDGRDSYGVEKGGGLLDLGRRLARDFPRLADLIRAGAWDLAAQAAQDDEAEYNFGQVTFLPPIAGAEKIICIGVNYANRNDEYRDNSELPKYPSLFMRTPGSLVGHDQPLVRPKASEQLDYEGEIVLIVGKDGRHVPRERAHEWIAALSIGNEGSIRDWLRHSKFNVTQGKNFDRSGSIGPWIVPARDIDLAKPLHMVTRVNGEVRQDDTTANMIFDFACSIAYLSTFMTLKAGDVIFTGTPPGAGARFDPPKWLKPGDIVEVEVDGIGVLRNGVIDET